MTRSGISISRHLHNVFSPYGRGLIRARAERVLKDVQFDTMVCTGLSGTIAAAYLQETLYPDARLVVVRKPHEQSHGELIEGHFGDRWLFVDDFVSRGITYARVIMAVRAECRRMGVQTDHVGAFLYHTQDRDTLEQGVFQAFEDENWSYTAAMEFIKED
jgi:orotate phosphoribosyltransferase